jgi:hypothetical protein
MNQATQLDSDAQTQLVAICREIASRRLSLDQWSAVESSDEFQSERLVGGFEATEGQFTFSYFDVTDNEWWFNLTLEQALGVAQGNGVVVELREPQ